MTFYSLLFLHSNYYFLYSQRRPFISLCGKIVFLIYHLCQITLKYSVVSGVAMIMQTHWTETSGMYRAIRTQIWAWWGDFWVNENFRSYNKVMLIHAKASDIPSMDITWNAILNAIVLFWFKSRKFPPYLSLLSISCKIGYWKKKKKKVMLMFTCLGYYLFHKTFI